MFLFMMIITFLSTFGLGHAQGVERGRELAERDRRREQRRRELGER